MPTLKEMLAKQKLERQMQNDAQSTPSNSAISQPTQETRETVPAVIKNSAGSAGNRGSEISENIAANGSGISVQEPAVSSARPLTFAEKMAARKAIVEGTAYTSGPRQAIAEKLTLNTEANLEARFEAAKSEITVDKHTSTSDGNIELEALQRNLEYLANNIEQVELVRSVVVTIATQLRQNPQLTPHMKDADVNLVVRGLRRAYHVAAFKKAENKEKKSKKSDLDIELGEAFKSLGIG